MEDRYKTLIAITGLVCVTAYGIYMAHLGINSAFATSVVGAISGIVGAILGAVVVTKKGSST